eukprot:Platyproteum_vivax@DN935_c0_g1_i1.p1
MILRFAWCLWCLISFHWLCFPSVALHMSASCKSGVLGPELEADPNDMFEKEMIAKAMGLSHSQTDDATPLIIANLASLQRIGDDYQEKVYIPTEATNDKAEMNSENERVAFEVSEPAAMDSESNILVDDYKPLPIKDPELVESFESTVKDPILLESLTAATERSDSEMEPNKVSPLGGQGAHEEVVSFLARKFRKV